ncbi:MAG: DUF4913 domain-containing protein [Sporichthyaceae bacterium]|nr:DUF4913 domain-containing protein [Sporichthyaceae bacterium]
MTGHAAILAEDVADALARITRLDSLVASHANTLDELTAGPAGGTSTANPFEQLVRGDPAIHLQALARLDEWVRNVLAPVYRCGEDVGPDPPWCHLWWEHPEAVARLYALWMAWQDLALTSAGPSHWHRDHLAPALTALRDPRGTFARCTTHPDKPRHTKSPMPPLTPLPELAQPEADPAGEDAMTVMPDARMREALASGAAEPASSGLTEWVRLDGLWWRARGDRWVVINDPLVIRELDDQHRRLSQAQAVIDASQAEPE